MNSIWEYLGEKIILTRIKTRMYIRLCGGMHVFLPCEIGDQPRVLGIMRQIARSFPTVFGLAREEKCGEDRRKSV